MANQQIQKPSSEDTVPQSRERLAPVGNRGASHETPDSSKEYPGGDRGEESAVNQRQQEEAARAQPDLGGRDT